MVVLGVVARFARVVSEVCGLESGHAVQANWQTQLENWPEKKTKWWINKLQRIILRCMWRNCTSRGSISRARGAWRTNIAMVTTHLRQGFRRTTEKNNQNTGLKRNQYSWNIISMVNGWTRWRRVHTRVEAIPDARRCLQCTYYAYDPNLIQIDTTDTRRSRRFAHKPKSQYRLLFNVRKAIQNMTFLIVQKRHVTLQMNQSRSHGTWHERGKWRKIHHLEVVTKTM